MDTCKREFVAIAVEIGGDATRAQARADFFDFVGAYFNRVRRHSALGCPSPVDFEKH